MYFSDNFDAKLFLSRIHHDTSAANLEAGALGLKTDLKGRTQQRKQLVKDNFDCFVSCKTTIDGTYAFNLIYNLGQRIETIWLETTYYRPCFFVCSL